VKIKAKGNQNLMTALLTHVVIMFFVIAAKRKNICRQVKMPASKTKCYSVNNQLFTVPERLLSGPCRKQDLPNRV